MSQSLRRPLPSEPRRLENAYLCNVAGGLGSFLPGSNAGTYIYYCLFLLANTAVCHGDPYFASSFDWPGVPAQTWGPLP